MFDGLRSRLKRAGELSVDAYLTLDMVGRSEVWRDLNLSGVIHFAKDLRHLKLGPHMAVHFHAQAHGERPAVVLGDKRLSYAEFGARINQLARGLAALGVSKGDAVAMMLPNCLEHLVAQETMPRLGAVSVQIGYRLKGEEIAHILDNSDAQVLIYHHAYEGEVRAAMEHGAYLHAAQLLVVGAPDDVEVFGSRYEDEIDLQARDLPRFKGAGEGGVIIYTSGTTGKPKGATRSWRDTGIVSMTDLMRQTGMKSDERHIVVCPLYHAGALAFVKLMTALGGCIILLDHFDAEELLATIEREKATSAFMVPTMLVRLNALDDEVVQRYDTSSLRWVMSGAAPLATATALRFQERFGPLLYNFYGATEIGAVTAALPTDHGERPGSVGKALRGNEIRILNDYGDEVPTGSVGELYVRNNMLIGGYHKNPDATQRSTKGGFFSVGDLARVDEDGYLYLASRKHDMVISGGVNIYPREIEEVLHAHPSVEEAAVVGVPDEEWGESLRAFVVLRPGASASDEDLALFCKDRLASYKQPRSVVFLDELPRNATGKVLKRDLKERG